MTNKESGQMSRFALITGGAGGVGSATAKALTEAGWTVAISGRNAESLEKMAAEIGGNTLALVCDVGEQAAVRELFQSVKSTFGRLDLLFNNAGILADGTAFEDIPEDAAMALIRTNIAGVFFCAQEAFRIMKSQNPVGGRIINNGSLSAQVPRPNSALYTASKHAVSGLTKSFALDGRNHSIACGQIDIGNANTPMATHQREGIMQPHGAVMVEPTKEPRHVADALVYMAGLPVTTNVPFITVMATGMPWAGRG
jgi:NAD(P)-dependent dehydrogenase (short-subunit alcohol dehydrogenase family)